MAERQCVTNPTLCCWIKIFDEKQKAIALRVWLKGTRYKAEGKREKRRRKIHSAWTVSLMPRAMSQRLFFLAGLLNDSFTFNELKAQLPRTAPGLHFSGLMDS